MVFKMNTLLINVTVEAELSKASHSAVQTCLSCKLQPEFKLRVGIPNHVLYISHLSHASGHEGQDASFAHCGATAPSSQIHHRNLVTIHACWACAVQLLHTTSHQHDAQAANSIAMAARHEIRTTFHKRRFPRPSWLRSKNSPSAADLELAADFDYLNGIDNLDPPQPEFVREESTPDDADIEELRRLNPEEFRKRWNALENRVRVAEGMVDIRPDRLRTAGRPSVKEFTERVDSGLVLADNDVADDHSLDSLGDDEFFDARDNFTDEASANNLAKPRPGWKGKARANDIEAVDRQKPLAGLDSLEDVMRRLIEFDEKYNRERTHDCGPTPSRGCLPTDNPLTAMTRDCAICTDELFVLDFPVRNATSTCNHPVRSCKGCLNSWLTSELADKGHESLTCPECSKELSYEDVRRALPRETFAMYDRLKTKDALADLPDFAWCLNPKCENGQLNEEPAQVGFMRCAACKYEQCLHHRVEWHWHESCEEYDHRVSGRKANEEEAKTLAMLENVSKPCPGPSCKWRLQKIDGCDQ
jgi:hypothetical protein